MNKNAEDDFGQKETMQDWIENHITNLIQDIIELVNIPSVSNETGDAARPFGQPCLEALLLALSMVERLGFVSENHENYCGTLLWNGEKDEEIGIFGHLDVVPEGTGWQYEPYQAVVKDGLIIGRGAADNKGSVLSALYALKYLKDSGYQLKHSIRMFLGCNEEAGMKDIEYYIEHHPMPAFSFTPDASFPVCHGEKGVMELDAEVEIISNILMDFHSGIASNAVSGDAYATLNIKPSILEHAVSGLDVHKVIDCGNGVSKIEVKGIAKHAAFPEGSESAEVKLAMILQQSGVLDEEARHLMDAILTLFSDYYGNGIGVPYEDEISGKLTHVGGMARMEHGKFHQNINIRYTITADRPHMLDSITTTMNQNGFVITQVKDSAPCYVNKEEPIIRKLTAICNKHLGMELVPYVMGGGTYARKLNHAVGYGPGIPNAVKYFGTKRGGAHQPDEYVEINRLKKAIAIYTEAIVAIDKMLP